MKILQKSSSKCLAYSYGIEGVVVHPFVVDVVYNNKLTNIFW